MAVRPERPGHRTLHRVSPVCCVRAVTAGELHSDGCGDSR